MYDKTNIIQREPYGLAVSHETSAIQIDTEQSVFTVEPEAMGFNATRLIAGSDIETLWLWGDGEVIGWGDGEEIEL